jgi:subtilase family serine protease
MLLYFLPCLCPISTFVFRSAFSRRLRLAAKYLALVALVAGVWNAGHAQQTLQVLQHHVRPAVSNGQAALVAPLPGARQMNLTIVIPLRNQDQLTSLLSRLYDPSSPDYHKFLSVDQFTEQFGPTAADYQAVVDFARSNGFSVSDEPSNRLLVPIRGPVAQINKAFHVRMNTYQHPTENRTFFSPDREPSLALSVPVAHIAGMNNYSLPKPAVVRAPSAQEIADVAGSGPGGSYLGSDMRAAYYGGTTLTGIGQAVGLFEFGGYYLSDVNSTFSNAGQTYSVPINNVLLDGATGAPGSEDAEEVLDIVQAIGMAPGLSQVRVYIGNAVDSLDDANIFNSMATENIAKQISVSWGWYPDDPTTDDVFFEEFAAQGQTLFVASGDEGAFDVSISPFFYPAEDVYVTAVGGTHLTTTGAGGAWVSETAWNSEGDGSGGGISPDGIAIPSWQTGAINSSNGGSSTLRNEPDVAMEGDFDNYNCNVGVCEAGWAGTSFAAPRWAGFMALVNQQAVEAGNAPQGGIGFINQSIYTIGEGSSYNNDFHDITSGNNDTDNQPVWYSAVTGYDLVTGWGSANGQDLINDLAGPQVPGFWLESSSALVNVNPGGSGTTTITVTDAGGFTGNVTLAITSALPSGVTASWGTNPTSGTSVLTLTASSSTPVGTTNLTIIGTSGNLKTTTTLSVSINVPTFVLSAWPSNTSVNQGGSTTSTVTVTPEYGFTGSVNLAASGLPTGVTATWGTNPTSGTSVLTLTASSTAPASTGTVTITGTCGSLTITTTVVLTVYAPTFTLGNSGNVSVGQNSSTGTYIYIYNQDGFNGSVNMTVSGLPAGVTASFSPNPATYNSYLQLTTSSSTAPGIYTLTVTGTSGSITATTSFTLTVNAPGFTLTAVSANIGQGSTTTTYVFVNDMYGFTGNVNLTLSGLPSGVTASFSPNPSSYYSMLTFTASGSAGIGSYTLTLTGTSGSLTATTTMTLGVYAPGFTLSSAGYTSIGQGSTATSYVYMYPEYGFDGNVTLSASGLPSGVTASFSPNPTSSTFNTMTLTASSSTLLGSYSLTINGKSGPTTASAPLTLQVNAQSFTIYDSPNSVSLLQGNSNTTEVYVNPQNGFNGNVSLAVSGMPSGVTADFAPNPTSTGSSVLMLMSSSTTSAGTYNLTITGTSGSLTATTTLALTINAPTFALSDMPGDLVIDQGNSATSTVTVIPAYGFGGSVGLAASGLPSGVSASWSTNPTIGSSVLTLTASSSATPGKTAATITGTSGGLTVTTPLTVTVRAVAAATTTTLAVTSAGSPVTSVSSASMVTLTATVGAGSTAVTAGQVNFCDATAAYCEDIHILGSAQLTSAGTAVLNFIPGIGSHSYKAVFAGTSSNAKSASNASPLQVTGSFASTNTIAQSGVAGNYTLTATVAGQGPLAPTGTVSFLDTSNANSSLGTAALGGGQVALNWLNPQSPATGSYPDSVVTADFNGDGIPDLAVTNSDNYTVTILLGNGDGTFTTKASPTTGYWPTSMLTADFNGDGKPDLAVINGDSNTLTILLGNGDGTFKSAASPQTGSSPTALVVGDFNGDGIPDLAVANSQGNTVTILLGNGDGTFTSGASSVTGSGPMAIVTADFNGDGIPDLAVANMYSGTVTILLGNGDGTFTPSAMSPPTGYDPVAIAVGDFNGDGIPDLAVANSDSATVTILLGNGDGTFTESWENPETGESPQSIAVADFNGDGNADLAVTNYYSNTLTVLLGNGDGTFDSSAMSPSTGAYPRGVAIADFNGDGKPDMAIVNNNGNSVTILTTQLTQTATATATGISPVGSGIHLVDASYPGDSNYSSSISPTTGLTATGPPPAPLSWTTPASITYGTTLGTTQLDATSTVAGTYAYTPPAGTLLGAGKQTLSVLFTPNDTTDYSSATATVTLTVNQATPAITWPTPAAIVYGTPLSSTQLDATSTVAGSFTYTPPAGTVLAGGNQPLKVTFAPADTADYTTATDSVTLTVNRATPTVTVTPSSYQITTAQALTVPVGVSGGAGNQTATGSVILSSGSYTSAATPLSSGSATINIPAESLAAGSDTLKATYTPDSNSSSTYNSATGTSSAVTVTAGVASTPTFMPAAGTYTSAQSVTITDATAGAAIYFTTNGTAPTTASTKYTTAVTVSSTETLQAIATASGYSNSAVASSAYTINLLLTPPTFSPAAGSYTTAQSVTISDTTSGAAIYYTTNGTAPTTASTKYSAAITVSSTETLEAIATASGYTSSTTATAKYTITPTAATPTFSPAAGAFSSTQSVTITDATSGATIYYTTNGVAPTTASTKYAAAVTIASTETLEAIAVETGYANSTVATAAYTIAAAITTPTFTPGAGTYTSKQSVTITDAISGATIYYTTNGTVPTTASAKYTSAISVPSNETLEAIATASGFLNSSVATAKYTIVPTVATPTFTPAVGTYTASQSVTITDATSGSTIYYTTNGTAPTTNSTKYTAAIAVSSTETLQAIAAFTGFTTSPVATATYNITHTVAAPSFSPAAGTYATAETITLSDATPGATIYYTTNNTTPTTASTYYTVPIKVSTNETIEAIAVASGYTNSTVASGTYTIE